METLMNIAATALQVAQTQLGQAEEPMGSNSGPMVDKYLSSVGLGPGYAWCMAFVHWCYQQAAKDAGVDTPVRKTASVHDCWDKADPSHKITAGDLSRGKASVQPGDQFILLFGKGTGHTGIVEYREGSTIHTIEGNSNTDGGREGYEVVRHQRQLSDQSLQGFIRYNTYNKRSTP